MDGDEQARASDAAPDERQEHDPADGAEDQSRDRRRGKHRWAARVRPVVTWVLTPTEEPKDEPQRHPLRLLRGRIAIAIVLVSILSAFAAWRASVHDETAAHEEARFRQELVLLQQQQHSDEDAVVDEVLRFGAYEENASRALQLTDDAVAARRAGHRALARRLKDEALRESRVSHAQLAGFVLATPWDADGEPDYDPVAAYRLAVRTNPERAKLDPGELRHAATAARGHGVTMTMVAALFIAALVFLTLAEVALTPRLALRPEASAGKVTQFFVGSAALTAVAAGVLFATVPWN